MKQIMTISAYLALKEIWRNRGRFLLVSLVIALITLLVLFIAALGEGLGNGNREYLSKLDAQLIVYQEKSDFLIAASRLNSEIRLALRSVDGVVDAGMLGTANATLVFQDGSEPLIVTPLCAPISRWAIPRSFASPRAPRTNSTDCAWLAFLTVASMPCNPPCSCLSIPGTGCARNPRRRSARGIRLPMWCS